MPYEQMALQEPDGMWAQILRNKYLQSKMLAQVTIRPTDSPFWKGLMRTKDLFFRRVKFLVGNGSQQDFGRIHG